MGSPLFAEDPPGLPRGSSAEVIETKIREEAKKEVSGKTPEPISIQTPETPKKKGGTTTAFAREIRVRSHASVPQEKFDALFSPEFFKPFLTPYLDRKITFDELTELTVQIEEVLRAKGYFAVVRVPPQDVSTGEILLEVLLSRMGDLSVEGNRFFRKKKISSYWQVPEGQILRYDQIKNSIASINENPDRKVQPLLKAGKELGTTDVILKTEDHFPLHANYGLDNQGVKLTGKDRNTFSLRSDNLLSLDDTFLVGTTFGKYFGALFLQHIIPITSYGTRFSWGFSHAQVNPKKEFEEFGINGISQTYSLGLSQRLYRSDSILSNAYLGFDLKEKRTRVLSVMSTWDRLRVLSAGGDIQYLDRTGIWLLKETASFGFSPHGDGYPLTSRGAESSFFKWTFGLERLQKLPFGTEGSLRFEGLLSPDKLTPQEELFFGGATTVRGYPESDYGADQGILNSAEYRVPLFFVPANWKLPRGDRSLRDQIQILGFFDHAYGRLNDPSDTESNSRTLMSFGGGFVFRFRENLIARLDCGVPVGDDALTESGSSQVHFRIQTHI